MRYQKTEYDALPVFCKSDDGRVSGREDSSQILHRLSRPLDVFEEMSVFSTEELRCYCEMESGGWCCFNSRLQCHIFGMINTEITHATPYHH
jgi:hypothetical protein